MLKYNFSNLLVEWRFSSVGLAGVYHIKDHYEHEKLRGLEDVSCMHRAMYGDDHFGRFSPTVIQIFTEHLVTKNGYKYKMNTVKMNENFQY